MKTFILVYDGFVMFEVGMTSMFMKTKGDVITVGFDGKDVTANDGFVIKPHMQLKDVNPDEVELFVIPGGKYDHIYNTPALNKLLNEINKSGKVIAAICAGPLHLATAGLLDGRKYTSYKLEGYEKDFETATYVDQMS